VLSQPQAAKSEESGGELDWMSKHRPDKSQPRTPRQILHDIATPLTNAVLDVETLQESLQNAELTPTGRVHLLAQLAHLQADISRMKRLLQDYHRDVAGLEQTTFAPLTLLKKIIAAYQKPYGVKCRLRGRAPAPRLFGSQLAFEQMITHIFNNAVESYSPCQADRLIDIYYSREHHGWQICITDHGCGMSAGQLLAWNLIKRAGWPRLYSRKFMPSGLGLLETQRLIQQGFGGELFIYSRRHHGTTVVLFFPLS